MVALQLAHANHVSITSDNWQSNSQNDYLSCTVHYVDQFFNLKNKCLAMRFVENPKTAIKLNDMLKEILTSWKIDKKVYIKHNHFYLVF